MSYKEILFIAICVPFALGLAAAVLAVLRTLGRKPDAAVQPPPVPTSLSFLAGLSFFSGLGAILLVVASVIVSMTFSMGETLRVDPEDRQGFTLASKIVLYASLLPGAVAIAFALAARGVISESGGAVRGRPLYRTGVLLAVLSGAVVFDARVLNPATWASVLEMNRGEDSEGREGRGYLGVELEASGSVRVVRVVPGSPAERAGIQSGDWIVQLNGKPMTTGAALLEQIGSLAPGSRAILRLHRGVDVVIVTAELTATFETLHGMLLRQSIDEERLHILKAAGVDHRYSADELTKICATFSFDDGRLQAIQQALPHLQDPQNAYAVLGALQFADAKAKAGEWIAERARPQKTSKDE